jgi:hypothetical protein
MWSVPIGCSRLGGCSVAVGSMAFGSWLVSSGAARLAAISTSSTSTPNCAPRLRKVRRVMRSVGDSPRNEVATGAGAAWVTVGAVVISGEFLD